MLFVSASLSHTLNVSFPFEMGEEFEGFESVFLEGELVSGTSRIGSKLIRDILTGVSNVVFKAFCSGELII